jgi:3,4-dihydroxy-2-butanone 4-phosphate synthase
VSRDPRPPGLVQEPADLAAAEAAVRAFGQGRIVLLLDDSGPTPRGVLVAAAESITTAVVNFMAVHGRGLICAAMPGERLQHLGIPMIGDDRPDDDESAGPAFAVTVDARAGTSSGTSAADRALTLRVLAAPDTRPRDLSRPGHIMPIRTARGGTLRRLAYPEATVDLTRMAGVPPVGATCEVLGPDGQMAGPDEVEKLARAHGLPLISLRTLALRRIAAEGLTWDGAWPPGPGVAASPARGEDRSAVPAPIPPVRAIAAVTVRVSDQQRALDFYVGKLGFVKRRDNQYGPGGRWIEVGLPGSEVTLALIGRGSEPAGSGGARFTDVILGTADIWTAYVVLRDKGVEFRTPPTRQAWGSLYAELQDPDGNVLILVER